jgi:2,4-dienoyl-CoA reductase-like NADH-dependent reductase (Old Yellow Enzyme family)
MATARSSTDQSKRKLHTNDTKLIFQKIYLVLSHQIVIGAAGAITSAQQAEQILRAGQADAILMARQFLRDPYFPLRAAKELGVVVGAAAVHMRAGL